ncbi:MAG: MFS transporter [Lachnospiraceae bacterium]|nr:MFS transporter [Lachnospiraceae bacterium]
MKLSMKEKVSYGLGAVGKDMVYMLSASYILYYYQDILGVSAAAMGAILLAARVFDAFNDPIMGVVVAKTKTKWGKFRPWLMLGTITNAIILVLMFSAPPALTGGGLVAYAAVTYILWGVTYTMMDIPYWSMVPAFTQSGKDRESLSALARSCAGVGSAVISIITVMAVSALGHLGGGTDATYERLGYSRLAMIVAAIFVAFICITCLVISIVAVNTALYITSNLVIYFFKYDFSPAQWEGNYTLFNTAGGGFQILAMMLLFPMLRKFMSTMKIFYTCFGMAFAGYAVLLVLSFTGTTNVVLLLIPAFLIMAAIGMLNVIVTVFLANTVDYGEYKNNRRDESVIFSMQTFVVKLASGVSAFIAGLVLQVFHISETEIGAGVLAESSRLGLRMSMTIIPIVILLVGVIIFKMKYILTDEKLQELTDIIKARRA